MRPPAGGGHGPGLIDTAAAYMNERVGEGIRRSGIARNEMFLETKLWIGDHGYDTALHAFDESARDTEAPERIAAVVYPSAALFTRMPPCNTRPSPGATRRDMSRASWACWSMGVAARVSARWV